MLRHEPWTAAHGASLIEAIVALGLLATVLISASGLLGLGNRQVASAGHRSRAQSVADSVIGELSVGAWRRLFERFDCDVDQAECVVDLVTPTALPGALTTYELPDPQVELRLAALSGTTLAATPALRITVEVSWVEGLHLRRLKLASLRV